VLTADDKEWIRSVIEDKFKDGQDQSGLIQLVNTCFKTEKDHLPELTILPPNEIWALATDMAVEHLHDPERIARGVSLAQLRRQYYMQLQRSKDGLLLKAGIKLAADQIQTQAEKAPFDETREAF